jgi:hypothetical protein
MHGILQEKNISSNRNARLWGRPDNVNEAFEYTYPSSRAWAQ